MSNQLINIALASAFYEKQKNYLDTYLPFVIKSFHTNQILDLKEVSDSLSDVFGIQIPINSIKQILASQDKKIFQINKQSKHNWSICLTPEGKLELEQIITSEERQANKLSIFYNSIVDFSNKEFNKVYSLDEVNDKVQNFIIENLIEISVKKTSFSLDKEYEKNGFEQIFVNYLLHIKTTSLENTETFDDIWKGTIIWNEMRKPDLQREEQKFEKKLDIFIDTNFILSLLELHNNIINLAAKELYDLIKSTPNLNLYVLDITLQEIYDLLDTYTLFKDDFYEIEIDTVFYYLKKNGYNAVKIEKLKEDLPNLLKNNFGISRVETPNWSQNELLRLSDIYNHLLDIRTERNQRLEGKLKKRDTAIDKSSNHDSSAINFILKIKDKFSLSIEKSKAMFLTSSFLLFKDYKKISNKFESVPAVVLDATLTNILYLKNPNSNTGISIDQVIKVHCNYLIIDKSIWTLYLQTLNELKTTEKISIDDYTRLISKNQITENYLLKADQDNIQQDEILELLEKIKNQEKGKEEQISILSSNLSTVVVEQKELITEKQVLIKKISEKETIEQQQSVKIEELSNSIAEIKFNNATDEFNKNLTIELDKEISKLKRKNYWSFTIYALFAILSIGLYFLSEYIKTIKSTDPNYGFLTQYNSKILFILFSIPFIRSFIKHDKIIDSCKFIFSRTAKQNTITKFTTEFITKYEEDNRKPQLTDYK
jgi:hypothetical protein